MAIALRPVNFSDSNFPRLMIPEKSLNEEITSIFWKDLMENHRLAVHLTSAQRTYSYSIQNEKNHAGEIERNLFTVFADTPTGKKFRILDGNDLLNSAYTKTSNNSLCSMGFAVSTFLSLACTAAALYPSRPWYYPIFLKNPRAEKEIALFWGCVTVVSAAVWYFFNSRHLNAKFELCQTLVSMAVLAHNQKENNDKPHVFTAKDIIVHRPL